MKIQKDGKRALLHLNEFGYDNILIAVFAEPFETIDDLLKANAEALKIKQEASRKSMIKFFKFVVCPIFYLFLFAKFPVPIFLLTIVGAGWLIFKSIKKTAKKAKSNSTSV